MFSSIVLDKFNKYKDRNGYVKGIHVQKIMHELGFAFNRSNLKTLCKWGIIKNHNFFKNESQKQTQILCNYEAVLNILVYLMAISVLPGMRRGEEVLEYHRRMISYIDKEHKTMNLVQWTSGLADILKIHLEDIYSPDFDDNKPDINSNIIRLIYVFTFLNTWILFSYNDSLKQISDDWNIMRSYVIGSEKGIPLYNQYQQGRLWKSNSLTGSSMYSTNGADLASSIFTLDQFIAIASAEDVRTLQCWLEIIITFETGAGFVVAEAKKALERIPGLKVNCLIDDWWLLAFIYIHGMNK